MNARDYNSMRMKTGKITPAMVTTLTEFWQRHHDLAVDGFLGPNTIHSLQPIISPGGEERIFPLIVLPDGRRPVITSGFKTENPDRSTHDGVDFFYRWLDSDPDVSVGDGGAIKKNGRRRWWYPPRDFCDGAGLALAASSGVVEEAKQTQTGGKIWVEHIRERSGYFHLEEIWVDTGDLVQAGQPLGVIGDNPKGHDGKHLHFEISPLRRYHPRNPRVWLQHATYIHNLPTKDPP